jgi:hypothetical protein
VLLLLLGVPFAVLRHRGWRGRSEPTSLPHAVPHADTGIVRLASVVSGPVGTIDLRIDPHADAGMPRLGGPV